MPNRQLPSSSGRPSAVIFAAALALPMLSGCDGGRGFAVAVEVDNACDVPIVVSFDIANSDPSGMVAPSTLTVIPAGESVVLNNAVLEPLPDIVYVFVAEPTAQAFLGSSPLAMRDLPVAHEELFDVYHLSVAREMCP